MTALDDLLDPWIASLRARSPNTARSYMDCVSCFLSHIGDDGVTPAAVARYLLSLDDLALSSRAHHISAARSFLRFAQAQGVIPRSPIELLVRPRVAITSMNRYLTLDELRVLLTAARGVSPRHHAACLLLALTGLRVGEAAASQWRHVFTDPDGRRGMLVVGKGNRERVVKVPDALFDVLAELHGSDRLDAFDRTPLIPGTRGTAYTPNGLWRLVHAAAAASGIAKPCSPHWLRHSHATLAARGGASAFVIQAALGHTHLETSARYIHWAVGLQNTTADYLPPLG